MNEPDASRWQQLTTPRVKPRVSLPWYPPGTANTLTLAHHPRAMRAFLAFATRMLLFSSLPHADRELVVLRTTWNAKGYFAWAHHANIARLLRQGKSYLRRVSDGPDADGWSERQAVLLRAVDELQGDYLISDCTWVTLREHLSEREAIELCMWVGAYTTISVTFNSLGVQFDGWTPPELWTA